MMLPVVPVVDTGVDDALALVVAARHPRFALRGVVCSAGNVPLRRVLANTALVLRTLDVDVPVAAGADRRLDGTPFPERDAHGPDGLAGLASGRTPPIALAGTPSEIAAGAVVVSLGPLTTLAAVAADRIVASYARPGEANHAMDPAAAAGVGYQPVDVPPHRLADVMDRPVEPARTPVGRLVDALLAHQLARDAGLGDAAVMLALAEPESDPAGWARRLIELADAEHWPR